VQASPEAIKILRVEYLMSVIILSGVARICCEGGTGLGTEGAEGGRVWREGAVPPPQKNF